MPPSSRASTLPDTPFVMKLNCTLNQGTEPKSWPSDRNEKRENLVPESVRKIYSDFLPCSKLWKFIIFVLLRSQLWKICLIFARGFWTLLTFEAFWNKFVCSTRSNSFYTEIFVKQRNSDSTNQRALWLICNPTPLRLRKTKKSNVQKVSRSGRCSRVDKKCRQK